MASYKLISRSVSLYTAFLQTAQINVHVYDVLENIQSCCKLQINKSSLCMCPASK